MMVHFICRGNAFRSIIAETYLNSLAIGNVSAISSGTVAASHRERNLASHRATLEVLDKFGIRRFAKAGYADQLTQSRLESADITVCLNERVYDDCLRSVRFLVSPLVWSVADVGEPGRIAVTDADKTAYREAAYGEIAGNVDRLVGGWPA